MALDREGQSSASVASEGRHRRRAALDKAGRLTAKGGRLASASVGRSARLPPAAFAGCSPGHSGRRSRPHDEKSCEQSVARRRIAGSRGRWLLARGMRRERETAAVCRRRRRRDRLAAEGRRGRSGSPTGASLAAARSAHKGSRSWRGQRLPTTTAARRRTCSRTREEVSARKEPRAGSFGTSPARRKNVSARVPTKAESVFISII